MKSLPSLTSLRTFSVVGKCLSFTEAARQLGVTQSAVSRQIKSLEESLDLKLFDRVGNSISLTIAGQSLHKRVSETFGLMADAVSDATLSAMMTRNMVGFPASRSAWMSVAPESA